MYTYEQKPYYLVVFKQGKRIGKIKAWKDQGFRYYAEGFKDGGCCYQSVEAVKRWLEDESL